MVSGGKIAVVAGDGKDWKAPVLWTGCNSNEPYPQGVDALPPSKDRDSQRSDRPLLLDLEGQRKLI
jgi:hypothetical protein